MADNDRNDNGRRAARGRPDRQRSPGARSDRPFRRRDEGDRPPWARPDEEDRPRGQARGERPFRKRNDDDRPRSQGRGERPFRERNDDDRPRGQGRGERPFRKRDDDRPLRFRRDGDDRAPRRQGRDNDRPFRKPRRDEAGGSRKPFARDERPPAQHEEPSATAPEQPAEERIAKVIARAGIASRRDAEAMIAEGRVTLNGEVLSSPAVNVKPEDRITVDGEPLPAKERTRLWIFHKPRGLVTTARDPEGRPTVFESLPEEMPRVVAVGRLDINTEGLLLLTNDGGLARVIAHPETGWLRRYKVRAHGEITQEDLDKLRDGITIEGIDYEPIEARLDRIQGDNVWLTMGLREGKNREIKNILEHLGLAVNRLIRLSFGPFQLGDLEPGLVEEVRTKVLREQLGQKLAEDAGVDFESPVREPIAPFGSTKKRPERPERGERPEREARPRSGTRPERGRGRDHDRDERVPRGRRDDHENRERPMRAGERRSTVWRADEDDKPERRSRSFRRGVDPKEARAASGARQHERVGAIAGAEGRKVLVERLVSEPKPQREGPPPRSRDERPRRAERDFDERRQRFDDGPRKPRKAAWRSDEGPRRGGPKGSGPRKSGPPTSGARGSGSGGPGPKGPRQRRP
jgi:23S rRNA pseudouridine2605 synthase